MHSLNNFRAGLVTSLKLSKTTGNINALLTSLAKEFFQKLAALVGQHATG